MLVFKNNINKKTNSSIYDDFDNTKTTEKHDKSNTPRVESVFDKYQDILSNKNLNDKDLCEKFNEKGKSSKGK